MPYITPEARPDLKIYVRPSNSGELNYVITQVIHRYIELDKLRREGFKYETLNSVIGVLECAKLELYRQIAAPYEDMKKEENGPVSDLDVGGLPDDNK